MNKKFLNFTIASSIYLLSSSNGYSNISISPYISIKSKKVSKKDKNDPTKEVETTVERQEIGVKGSVRFLKLMQLSLGVGQSELKKTEQLNELVDEYDEIDYSNDLDIANRSTTDLITRKETQRNAKLTLSVNPSFSIFIFKVKIGVTARQRIIESEIEGIKQPTITKGPTYKPHSGVGVGVRLSPGSYFMVEYGAYHYKFPKIEPFERELTVSYSVRI